MQDEEILQHIYKMNKDLHNARKEIEEMRKALHDLIDDIKKQQKVNKHVV